MDNNETGIAEPSTTAEVENVTASEFALRRVKEMEAIPEPEPVVESEEEEETSEPTGEIEETPEPEPEADDVLSQIDLDNLSQEQYEQLAEALKSRAASRIGKLTGDKKSLQERILELEDKIKSDNPLADSEPVKDNPFSDLNTVTDIKSKAKEINDVIDWAEDILFESSDYGPSDVVTEVDGKSMTKSEVREALKQSRKSRDTFLPDQFNKVQKVEQAAKLRQQYGQKALKEFEWLNDKESEQAKQFVALAADKRMETVYKEHPELSAQLPYLLAHAVNSLSGGVKKKSPKGAKPEFKLTPPQSPNSSSGSPDRPEGQSSKALKDLQSRFESTGSAQDLVKLRTKQLSKQMAG